MRLPSLCALCIASSLVPAASRAAEPPAARQLIGLWSARRHFGPRVRGPLVLDRKDTQWRAHIAGQSLPVRSENGRLAFTLPDQQGSFAGRTDADGRIRGHWTQPPATASGSAFVTPVVLEQAAEDRWRGTVAPLDDEMTLHMRIRMAGPHGEGKVSAFFRNPERNAGRSVEIEEVVLDGSAVRMIGRTEKDAPAGEVLAGRHDAEGRTLSLYIPWAGGTFDFRRATLSDESGFYARARTPAPYVYTPPPPGPDGWPVGTLEEAGISREAIAAFVNKLASVTSDDVQVHGLLVARRGRLVLEEYFHGFHRDATHDTRSATNVLLAALAGAAGRAGTGLDPDAKTGDAAAAAESLARATGRPIPELFRELLAGPLGLGPYALRADDSGATLAGARLLPRDFLKFAQLAADEGRWRGAAVVARDWARASAPAPEKDTGESPGHLWQSTAFEYRKPGEGRDVKPRKVRGLYSTGDGGQLLAAVPELELAVAFLGGNYGDEQGKFPLAVFVPGYILPAVD
jgi:CubicO group peptidase (beta-lactamase class C family)